MATQRIPVQRIDPGLTFGKRIDQLESPVAKTSPGEVRWCQAGLELSVSLSLDTRSSIEDTVSSDGHVMDSTVDLFRIEVL